MFLMWHLPAISLARTNLYTFTSSAHNSLSAFALGSGDRKPRVEHGLYGIGARSTNSALGTL